MWIGRKRFFNDVNFKGPRMLKFPSSFPFAFWVFRFLSSEALNSLSLLLLVAGSFNFELMTERWGSVLANGCVLTVPQAS
ncbi:hypothetical protein SDJN02_20108, partial [Cucurbita argyrosperma subsp. argyrosperma]